MSDVQNLEYSDEASATRYVFLKGGQKINIFIEDKNKEYQYEAIFNQLLPDIDFGAIFSSGGKSAMERLFYEFGTFDPDNPSHPNIYIVDGDFDRIISSENMIKSSNYIYLKAYNIENYLIDEKACVRFACGKFRKRECETKNIVSFNTWEEQITRQAKKLFLVYCYLKAYHPNIKNVNTSHFLFLDAETGFERDGAFENYTCMLKTQHQINLEEDKEKIDDIEEKCKIVYGDDFSCLICGKFLISSLFSYLTSIGVNKANKQEFEWWLINNINISKLSYLADSIKDIITNTEKDKVS